MNIVQKLSLNKHPKDIQDLSLVMAQNIKVSNDESCITNEEGIRENTYIKNFLENHYKKDYVILGIIPCNNELVIIASSIDNIPSASIFRYKENTAVTSENMKCVYDKLIYNGGKYTGTFTYNVEESLILALSEYDANVNVPIKVINLGNFDDKFIANDLDLTDNLLSLVPEIRIPTYTYDYVKGRAYKGWYFLFIRYKINSVDYTQWYNFGTPIYVDNYTLKNIVKESYALSDHFGQASGFSDTFSDDEDIVNNSFTIIKQNDNNISYKNYQLGFICSTKSYTKAYRTEDINISTNNYQLDFSNLLNCSTTELINKFYNYFDVKNVINYKNRLYISNYSESETRVNISNELHVIADKVNIVLNRESYSYDWSNNFNYDGGNKIIYNRTKNRTLIPNGVYNFFIHFVDKYGHATKGYKINPKDHINNSGINGYKTIIPLTTDIDKLFWIVPANIKLSELHDYAINNGMKLCSSFIENDPVELKSYTADEVWDLMMTSWGEFLTSDVHLNLYTSQLFNGSLTSAFNETNVNENIGFGITINIDGDALWRVPEENYINSSDSIGYKYTISVSLNNIPYPYVGYYISYEEYEPNKIVTGYLTKRNANVKGTTKIPNNNLSIEENPSEENTDGIIDWPDWDSPKATDNICFYSSTYDINDTINLNYNTLHLEATLRDTPRYPIFKITPASEDYFPTDAIENLNGIAIYNRRFTLQNYKLAVANDPTTNRINVGTCLLIENKDDLFSDNSEEGVRVYIASLYNYNNNIYTNKNKHLIRLSDIIYDNDIHLVDNYNGIFSSEGIIVYNDNGYIIGASTETNTNKSITSKNGNHPYLVDGSEYNLRTFGVSYVTFNVYDDIVFNSKVFNNKPKIIYNVVGTLTEENVPKVAGAAVEPINSIDLFKNPQGSIDNFYPIINTNYREDLVNVIQFDKTIRRSNIIQDETRVNTWRQFPVEGYKNITENKGKITNIVGIGYIFLVHTEHSLFMFDTNNLLQAINTDVQLSQPDAFEVSYKEVFTSDLGFGGLQDKEAAIVDTFGYIFYNNDSNRLYRFDNGQLATIDEDIIEWLYKVVPNKIRFANDKYNNRLLINIWYNNSNNLLLSYNYNIKSFISTHTYTFDKAYNTKNNLYLRCNNKHENCSLHQFIKRENNYGSYDNTINNLGTVVNQQSKIGIIVNQSFDAIKYLEYFSYKLSKVTESTITTQIYSPVEGTITPFAGNLLRVYNNLTDTGELDINVNEEVSKNIFAHFDKPYWHLGNWNYNYLRNNVKMHNSPYTADQLSRIIGNYFIIEFTFINDDNKLIEFEGLTYKVTQ